MSGAGARTPTSHSLPSSPHRTADSEVRGDLVMRSSHEIVHYQVFFYGDSMAASPSKGDHHSDQLNVSTDSRDIDQIEAVREIQKDYEQLKRSLSEEFNKKMSAWGQKKSSRDGGCQSVTDESQLSADFRKKLEEWQRMKRTNEVFPFH